MYRATCRRVRSATTTISALTAISLAAGCFDLFGPKQRAIPFTVSPPSTHMLVGDTTFLKAFSCAADGKCAPYANGNVVSDWTISGTGVAGGLANSMLSRSKILVRAVATGNAFVTAVASADSTQSNTARVSVRDSAAISAIEVSVFAVFGTSDNVIRVASNEIVVGVLKDAQGNRYITEPTQWSVSDATILQLSTGRGIAIIPGTRTVTGLKEGSADVIVRFRDIEGRLRLAVSR